MNTPELADLTTCKHCGQSFTGPRIEVIGQPQARLQAYIQILSKHFYEKHPREAQMMDIHTAIYSGLLFLMNFKTTDKELNEKRDQLRWTIHQQTLKARFSDESLKEQCGVLAETLWDLVYDGTQHEDTKVEWKRILLEAFTAIRDALEEPGKYPEAQTEQKLVVV